MRRTWEWFQRRATSAYAERWLAALSFAESSFFPIPVDVFLIAVLAAGAGRWMRHALITTVASILGAVFGYAIGFFVFEPIAQPIIEFYHLSEQFAHVGELYTNSTFWAVLAAAFTPIPFKVFVLAGGFFAVPIVPFLLASVIGRGVRFYLVSWLSHRYGPRAAELFLSHFNKITLALVALVAAWVIAHYDLVQRVVELFG